MVDHRYMRHGFWLLSGRFDQRGKRVSVPSLAVWPSIYDPIRVCAKVGGLQRAAGDVEYPGHVECHATRA